MIFTKAVSSWALEMSSTVPITASAPDGPLVGPPVSLLCSTFESEDTLSGVAMPIFEQCLRVRRNGNRRRDSTALVGASSATTTPAFAQAFALAPGGWQAPPAGRSQPYAIG